MAGRIRTIKPEILEDERSAGLSSDAWRLWVSMWLLADDHGRLRGAPSWLRSQVFWACPGPVDVTSMLSELDTAGVIVRYEVSEQKYIEIPNWTKHQKIDRPSNPRVPSRPDTDSRVNREPSMDPRDRPPTSTPITIQTSTPITIDGFRLVPPDSPGPVVPLMDFALVYALYPRKEGKTKGIERLRSIIRSPEAFQQLLTAVRHFAEKHAAEGTETGFIPYFSTWCNEVWKDYIDGPHIDVEVVARNRIQGSRASTGRGHARATAKYDKTSDGTGDL